MSQLPSRVSRVFSQLTLLTTVYTLALFGSVPIGAATITVDSTADNLTAGDGDCTLREATTNANGDTEGTGGDCTGGSGIDTIEFDVGGGGAQTVTLTSALPIVTLGDDDRRLHAGRLCRHPAHHPRRGRRTQPAAYRRRRLYAEGSRGQQRRQQHCALRQ